MWSITPFILAKEQGNTKLFTLKLFSFATNDIRIEAVIHKELKITTIFKNIYNEQTRWDHSYNDEHWKLLKSTCFYNGK